MPDIDLRNIILTKSVPAPPYQIALQGDSMSNTKIPIIVNILFLLARILKANPIKKSVKAAIPAHTRSPPDPRLGHQPANPKQKPSPDQGLPYNPDPTTSSQPFPFLAAPPA